MDEVEFRAWHKKEKKMYYNIKLHRTLGVDSISDCHDEDVCESPIWLQFIGRKDIENKKIYEEDILECDYDDFWDPDGYGYSHPNKKYRFIMRGKDFMDFPDIPRLVKIIGNKFEDPKLYKEVKAAEEI